MKKTATLGLLILIGFANLQAYSQNVGSKAPDFTLKDTNNQNFTLSQQEGKIVFVFMLGYACPYCISASSSIKSEILNSFSTNNHFVAVGIDTWNGSLSQVRNFRSSTGLNMPILRMGSDVASSWKTTYDRLIIIDSQGIMRYKSTQQASSSISSAKQAITNLLNNLTTDAGTIEKGESQLLQQYPNPANGQTTFRFMVESPSYVKLDIFSLTGKLAASVVNEHLPKGTHTKKFDASTLKRGIYFYTLESEGKRISGKMAVN